MWRVAGTLDATVTERLSELRSKLVGLDPSAQKAEAARLWKQSNAKRDRTFVALRERLCELCPGTRARPRCVYCEDSAASSIDHIWPKATYPLRAFDWDNMANACDGCQRQRGERWDVDSSGSAVFIDVRRDDPQRFLFVDLLGTFYIVPQLDLSDAEQLRAQRTIDWLALNSRNLCEARKQEHADLLLLIREHVDQVERFGESPARTASLQRVLVSRGHRSVWLTVRAYAQHLRSWRSLYDRAPSVFDCGAWSDSA